MMPDSRFPAGTFDPSEDVAVGPVLVTATLVRYEWHAVPKDVNGQLGRVDAANLNDMFSKGWGLDSFSGNVYLLKRQVAE